MPTNLNQIKKKYKKYQTLKQILIIKIILKEVILIFLIKNIIIILAEDIVIKINIIIKFIDIVKIERI